MKNIYFFVNLSSKINSKKKFCKKFFSCLAVFHKKSSFWKSKIKNLKYFGITLQYIFDFKKYINIFFCYNRKFKKKTMSLIWLRELTLGIFFILFGFFSATSAITIIGSVADWDPLAAAVMLCWIEWFTKVFYSFELKSTKLKIINSFKIGINFGMFVDALKLTS